MAKLSHNQVLHILEIRFRIKEKIHFLIKVIIQFFSPLIVEHTGGGLTQTRMAQNLGRDQRHELFKCYELNHKNNGWKMFNIPRKKSTLLA